MANSKQDNAQILDPNRFKVAQSMAVVPGGPPNNNPMNVDDSIEFSSFDGVNRNAYGDIGVINAPQLGGVWASPASGAPQQFTSGQMLNAGIPYGMQIQPPAESGDMLDAGYVGGVAKEYGLAVSPMGPIGMPVQGGQQIPMQSLNTLDLQGMPSAEVGALPPSGGMNTKTGKR